ncbi:MAG TPA: glycerol-3-phosphate acyltransferase [Candidatus Atribacteria bacterium]|nr:glycerol-3-phosphate acyltransferase [Candidatus Atribacteria bacterium]
MNILLGAILSYLFGSTPTAYLIFKKKKGRDIRKYGYKNMGALNVYHLLGPFHALITFLIDMAKGAIPIWVAQSLEMSGSGMILCSLMAIAGHNWPVFLNFHGGKGVATSLGIMMVLMKRQLLFWLVLVAIFFSVIKNFSFSMGLSFLLIPLSSWWMQEPAYIIYLSISIPLLMLLRVFPDMIKLHHLSSGNLRKFFSFIINGSPRKGNEI